MATPKRSGHARLKAALVLRDALCAELGLPLPAAMAQLRAVEGEHGCAQALDAGKYLTALSSVSTGDGALLTELDGAVRAACHRAGLAPRFRGMGLEVIRRTTVDGGAVDVVLNHTASHRWFGLRRIEPYGVRFVERPKK